MFREMRRCKQVLSKEDCMEVLKRNTSGVMAVSGDNDYPYAVPLSYVCDGERLYYHCAKTGHKIDGIARNSKVSFCVIDEDQIVQEGVTTYFRSVIAFGKVTIVEDEKEKRDALVKLVEKYAPDFKEKGLQEIEGQFEQVCVLRLDIDHLSGKEAIEFVRAKENK